MRKVAYKVEFMGAGGEKSKEMGIVETKERLYLCSRKKCTQLNRI